MLAAVLARAQRARKSATTRAERGRLHVMVRAVSSAAIVENVVRTSRELAIQAREALLILVGKLVRER